CGGGQRAWPWRGAAGMVVAVPQPILPEGVVEPCAASASEPVTCADGGVEVEGSAGHEVERRSQFDEGIQREVLEPVVEPYWESDAKVRARSVVIVPFPAVPVAPTAPGPNAQTRTIIECESAGGH